MTTPTIDNGAGPKPVNWPDGTPFKAGDVPKGTFIEIDPATGEILSPPRPEPKL